VVDIGAHEYWAEACSPTTAKELPDGSWLAVSGFVSGLFAGFFCLKGIEDICGIRASWVGGMPPEGAIATVYGLMSATADGERCLCVSTLTIAGGNQ